MKNSSLSKASAELIEAWRAATLDWSHLAPTEEAEQLAKHCDCLWRDNCDKSAAELAQIAEHLSPTCNGRYKGGGLARLVMDDYWFDIADPLLLAAIVWWNWYEGKQGFQFLPDPAKADIDVYRFRAKELIDLFKDATKGDPSRILTGDDLAFFNSLPEHVTVWRGCHRISPDQAGAGLCWTTRRDIAVWFAHRSNNVPVLMQAQVRKTEILLASASEFEVITMPKCPQAVPFLKHEPGATPDMVWSPAST